MEGTAHTNINTQVTFLTNLYKYRHEHKHCDDITPSSTYYHSINTDESRLNSVLSSQGDTLTPITHVTEDTTPTSKLNNCMNKDTLDLNFLNNGTAALNTWRIPLRLPTDI